MEHEERVKLRDCCVKAAVVSVTEAFNKFGTAPPMLMAIGWNGSMIPVGPFMAEEGTVSGMEQIQNLINNYLRHMVTPLGAIILVFEAWALNKTQLSAEDAKELSSGNISQTIKDKLEKYRQEVLTVTVQRPDRETLEMFVFPICRKNKDDKQPTLGPPECLERMEAGVGAAAGCLAFELAREWDLDLEPSIHYSNVAGKLPEA